MQADTGVVEEMLPGTYEFSELNDPMNVLVFPNLEAGNIGYKLLQQLGGAEAIGPMLAGMGKPVHASNVATRSRTSSTSPASPSSMLSRSRQRATRPLSSHDIVDW